MKAMDYKNRLETKDLGTPKHDELMIKLLQPSTWDILVNKYCLHDDKSEWEIHNIEAEVPVIANRSTSRESIAGYMDIVVRVRQSLIEDTYISCEIKATEPSLGSVIRQVNKYKVYTEWSGSVHYDHWVVISPYEEWQEPLKSQGILWIPSELVLTL